MKRKFKILLRNTWNLLPLLLTINSFVHIRGQEIPNNGIDDDNDGFVDCFDSELYGTAGCGTFYFGQPIPECREKPPVLSSYNLVEKYRTNQTLYPVDQRCGVFVGDVGNSDPYPELVAMGSTNSAYDRLYIFSGVDGSLVQYFDLLTGVKSFSQAAVGDVDRDGYADIFVNISNQLYRYEYNPTPVSGQDTIGDAGMAAPTGGLFSSSSSAQLADFNGDGTPEVYIENNIYNAQTLELIVDGGVLNTGKTEGDNTNNGDAWPLAYDVFKPGDIIPNSGGSVFGNEALGLELIAGSQVILVDFSDSTMSLGLSATLTGVKGNGDGFTSIADLNGDDRVDIIVTSINAANNACVFAWDPYTGDQIGTTFELGVGSNGTSKHGGRCNVADFDNDGDAEIGTAGKSLYVVLEYNRTSNTLEEKWSKRTGILDTSERTGSTLFDFEGDGSAEVVYSEENNLYVWKGSDGAEMANISSPSGTRTDYPLVADADGDGQAEIVITGQDLPGPGNSGPGYVAVYRSSDAPWVAARESWNQHGYHVTNLGQDMTVPAEQQLIVDPSFFSEFNEAFNGFLVQTTFLTEFADPTFAVGDLTTENVIVDLGRCGAVDSVTFTVTLENNGDWKAPRYTPIAIFDGDPYATTATYLGTVLIQDNVEKGGSLDITHTIKANGSGTLDLYVLVNHYEETLAVGDPLPTPLTKVTSPTMECDYVNNVGFIVSITTCNVSNAPRLDLDRDNSSGVTGNGHKKAFGVGSVDGAIIVDEDVFIIDDDNTNMAGATITLTNRPDGTNEYLQHPNAGSTVTGISISTYDSGTGQITLTGTATLSEYEDILNNITYYNTLDNATITNTNRIVEIQVSDGTNLSNVAVDSVLIEYKPTLDLDFDNSSGASGNDFQATYTENGSAVKVVDSDVYIETNGLDIQSVTIQHTNIQDGSYEGLFVNGTLPSGITVTTEYEYSVGTLVLSGAASPADYQTALNRVFYADSSDAPNTTSRVFTVQVTDIYLESLNATSTIGVTPVNDPPVLTGPTDSIFYNEGQGTVNILGYDFIVDIDDVNIESAVISLTTGFDNSEDVLAFTNQNGITGSYIASTGVLTLTGTATIAHYQAALTTVTYENTDGTDASAARRTITIILNDGDDNSTIYSRDIYVNVNPAITSSNTVNIDNGATAVLTVTAADANVGDSQSFSISGGADAADFNINPTSGVLTLNSPAVYATKSLYTVQVTVTDQGGLTGIQTLTVNVNDPSNPSPVINDAAVSLAENVANTTSVYNVDDASGGDTDSGGQPLTYAITAGNGDAIFDINVNTGEIFVDDSTNLDYETTQFYYLTITATDNHTTPASDNAVITVNITNINDNAPVIPNAIVSVSEGAFNNTILYDVNEKSTGNDTDLDGEALTYTIELGNSDNIFGINPGTGILIVSDSTNLDYETTKQYLLTIRANDGANTVDSIVTVNITGINDNNPVISNNTVSINENSANSTSVYNVNDDNTSGDTDIDEEPLTYSIVAGNVGGVFTISPATGEITVLDNTNLDYESTTQFILTVRADDGANTDDADITININDVVETATFTIDAIADVNINENTAYTSVTPNITGTPIGAITYRLSGADSADFSIDGNTGVVSMIPRDFENPADANSNNDYDLTIIATDSDGNTASEPWTVTIDNVTETATFTIDAIADVNINENIPYTSVIPDITGTPVGTIKYTLGGADMGDFTIDSVTGVVKMVPRDYDNPVDGNSDNVYEVTIIVTDDDGNTATESWTVGILSTSENHIPVANADSYTIQKDSMITGNVSDNDTGLEDTPVEYSVATDVSHGTLVLNADGSFTYTSDTGYTGSDSFVYTVKDADNESSTATVNITVAEKDTDGDGIPDDVEGEDDPDNDGIPSKEDEDSDGDGIPDRDEGSEDTDGDGTGDYKDLDSDEDGIPDEDEGTDDVDGDGKPNYKDDDSDGDGITDEEEGNIDTDEDGDSDYLDLDSDNDGISDSDEDDGDCDKDGVSNRIDPDPCFDGEITVPDGFSPNGDGTNETFEIKELEAFERSDIQIFNRWGNIVFKQDNYQNNWDGTSNAGLTIGDQLPSGTYFYFIEIKDNGEKLSGYIYLNR